VTIGTGAFGGNTFKEAPERSLLVGLAGTTRRFGQWELIGTIQAIYLTAQGVMPGKSFGTAVPQQRFHLLAKEGYAVGRIVGRGGGATLGFKLVFMRIKGAKLDPEDSYESGWAGVDAEGEFVLAGDGRPIVGIHGRMGGPVESFGVVQLDLDQKESDKKP